MGNDLDLIEVMSDKDFYTLFKDQFDLQPKKHKLIKKGYSIASNSIRIWLSEMKLGVEKLYFQRGLYNKDFKYCKDNYIYKLTDSYIYSSKGEDFIDITFNEQNFKRVYPPKQESVLKEKLTEMVDGSFALSNAITPNHYKNNSNIDVIDFCEAYNLDFALGNVVKYICRAGKKDNNSELQDLLKAKEYLERKIKTIENGSNN